MAALPAEPGDALARPTTFAGNLAAGIVFYEALVREPAFPGENLASRADALDEQGRRIAGLRMAIAQRQCAPRGLCLSSRRGHS